MRKLLLPFLLVFNFLNAHCQDDLDWSKALDTLRYFPFQQGMDDFDSAILWIHSRTMQRFDEPKLLNHRTRHDSVIIRFICYPSFESQIIITAEGTKRNYNLTVKQEGNNQLTESHYDKSSISKKEWRYIKGELSIPYKTYEVPLELRSGLIKDSLIFKYSTTKISSNWDLDQLLHELSRDYIFDQTPVRDNSVAQMDGTSWIIEFINSDNGYQYTKLDQLPYRLSQQISSLLEYARTEKLMK